MTDVRTMAHVHSEWSYDGKWSLERIARLGRMLGCNCVLMSEHDKGFSEGRWQEYRSACQAASTPRTLLIPGIEYSDPNNLVHILVWGSDTFLGEALETAQLLEEVRRVNAVSVFAHPDRKNVWQLPNLDWLQYVNGIEVWNRKTDGVAPSQNAMELVSRQSAIPFVGMDFHRAKQIFPLFMRMQLTESASERTIVNAIRLRECHAEAMGMRLRRFGSGRILQSLKGAEHARRWVARRLRPKE